MVFNKSGNGTCMSMNLMNLHLQTYNVDKQVADSAGSATAYLTGVKGRYGTLGLDVSAPYNICRPDLGRQPHVDSVLKWAQDAGKDTGLVTTTRVTHATPAGLYAHSANRDWECDSQVPLQHRNDPLCKDIARQLIEDDPGRNIKVADNSFPSISIRLFYQTDLIHVFYPTDCSRWRSPGI